MEDILHVLLSHIHLDHAGAAWAFARHGAKVYVHPKGYPHLLAPERLMASAKRIYLDQMDRLWGKMEPIAGDQLVQVGDKQSVDIGGIIFEALYTPGHATHHIAWKLGEDIFTGDVAGVSIKKGVIVPPCPPPDINIEDWQNSIEIIRQIKPKNLFLTHFGKISNVNEHLDQLENILLDWAQWMKPYSEDLDADQEDVTRKFQEYVKVQLIQSGIQESEIPLYETANPSWMSVAGLIRYWRKRLKSG